MRSCPGQRANAGHRLISCNYVNWRSEGRAVDITRKRSSKALF